MPEHRLATPKYEGVGDVIASKLADLSRSFLLPAMPLLAFYHPSSESLVQLKFKRGLIRHKLTYHEGTSERVLGKSGSATLLLGTALKEVAKLVRQGYIEV